MNDDVTISEYIKTGVACAIAYCIPGLFFFRTHTLVDSWILYIGNILFIIALSIATFIIHKRLHDETKMGKMIAIGMKLTIVSALFNSPLILAMYYWFRYNTNVVSINNKYGMLYELMLSAVVVNILLGFIAVILVAIIYNQIPKNVKGEDVT